MRAMIVALIVALRPNRWWMYFSEWVATSDLLSRRIFHLNFLNNILDKITDDRDEAYFAEDEYEEGD